MNFNCIDELKKNGFTGFKTVKELWENKSVIPKIKGVYLVINPKPNDNEFLKISVGGHFKNKNPNVSLQELKNNFVENSKVIYIGKAGSPTGKATLHSRIGQYLRFGQTKNVGHWGGRYIWQLKNHKNLVICWKILPNKDPRIIEKELIHNFTIQFGKKPFANLTR